MVLIRVLLWIWCYWNVATYKLNVDNEKIWSKPSYSPKRTNFIHLKLKGIYICAYNYLWFGLHQKIHFYTCSWCVHIHRSTRINTITKPRVPNSCWRRPVNNYTDAIMTWLAVTAYLFVVVTITFSVPLSWLIT
jgi:hypothetical protein